MITVKLSSRLDRRVTGAVSACTYTLIYASQHIRKHVVILHAISQYSSFFPDWGGNICYYSYLLAPPASTSVFGQI